MDDLLNRISHCNLCHKHLPHEPKPVMTAGIESRIAIVGQAPGRVVHETGIPWNDKSGERLREWLGVDKPTFYDPQYFSLIPMGFCYPGKGKSGDLPPRKECAPEWHEQLFYKMKNLKLIVLIGSYAQNYYLTEVPKKTLTETVKSYELYLPKYLVLPHPSPRNNIWLKKNDWFEFEVLPELKRKVKEII